MWEWIDGISQVIIAAGVIAGWWQSVRNGRSIETVHRATNSMKDELVSAVRSEATSAGIAAGRAQVTDEQRH